MTSVITNLLALPSPWYPILQYNHLIWCGRFIFSYIATLLPLSSPFITHPPTASNPLAFVIVFSVCYAPLNTSLHRSISCETFCSFHFLPQIYIHLLLTVNFNPSHAVFQVWTMNDCPLICASSSWLHVEQVGASLKKDQSVIVSVKVWESNVCLERTPLECGPPSLISPKNQLMIVSVNWYVINWDCGLVNCGTNILCGCWLFWQNKIQVFAGYPSLLLWETESEGCDVSSFHLIAQH